MKIPAILLAFAILFSSSFPAVADNIAPASQAAASSATQAGAEKKQAAAKESAGNEKNKADELQPMPGWIAGGLIVLSYILVLIGVSQITSRLMSAPSSTTGDGKIWTWSLPQALSEEVEFTTSDDSTGKKQTETRMVASTSRVIALFGLITLLVLFMGFGSIAMWYFATSAKMPDFGGILNYFYAGAGLFVPYGLNQFKAAFEAFSPKSR